MFDFTSEGGNLDEIEFEILMLCKLSGPFYKNLRIFDENFNLKFTQIYMYKIGSFLHSKEREKITKMMTIFKTPAILVCFLPHDPIKPQTSVQRLAHTRNVTTGCWYNIELAD